MLEQLNYFKDNRKHIRSKITRTCNEVTSKFESLNAQQSTDYLSQLKVLLNKVNNANELVSSGIWQHITDRKKLDTELDEIDLYDDICQALIRGG